MNTVEQESKQDSPEARTIQWWAGLKERKGDRARLCRARTLEQIYFIPAYHRLVLTLKGSPWSHRERIALVAGVLAHIRTDERGTSFPARLARPRDRGGSKPRFSGLRFRRLIQHDRPDEVFEPMIRAALQVGPGARTAADVAGLAKDLYWWNDRTRHNWAFAYYEANPGAE